MKITPAPSFFRTGNTSIFRFFPFLTVSPPKSRGEEGKFLFFLNFLSFCVIIGCGLLTAFPQFFPCLKAYENAAIPVFSFIVHRLRRVYCYDLFIIYHNSQENGAPKQRPAERMSNMKFHVNVNEINYGLGMVTRAIAVRPVKQAYECVMLESNPEGLLLTCTDGEITIKTQIASEIAEDGDILLPARLLSELMRRQSSGEAEIDIDDSGRAVIRASGSKTNMIGMSTEDFPLISDVSGGNVIVLSCGQLKNAISHVMFAVSNDESHKVLTGVLVESDRSETRLVGLDGFRLSLQCLSAGNEIPEGKDLVKAIVPGRIMNELSKMLPDDNEKSVFLTFNQTHIMISFENVKVYTSLLTGEFIDYRHVLPTESSTVVTVSKVPFLEALERCSLMAREGKNNLITLDIQENILFMSSRAERGDVREEMPVLTQGSPLRISFNANYLIDVIRNVIDDEMRMCFKTNISPCLVLPDEGNRYSYLVLPIRTFE